MIKRFMIMSGTFLAVFFTTTSLFSQDLAAGTADSTSKSSWYIGFGLGTGNGGWSAGGNDITFDKWTKGCSSVTTTAIEFDVGAIVTRNLNVGFHGSAINRSCKYAGASFSAQINNYLLLASFYPWENGFSLRAGAGMSAFVLDTSLGDGLCRGFAALAGIGYDLKLGSTFNLGLHVDYSYQKYNSSGFEPRNSNFWAVYGTCFWF